VPHKLYAYALMAKGARERVYTARKVYFLRILSLKIFILRCKTEIYFSKYIVFYIFTPLKFVIVEYVK